MPITTRSTSRSSTASLIADSPPNTAEKKNLVEQRWRLRSQKSSPLVKEPVFENGDSQTCEYSFRQRDAARSLLCSGSSTNTHSNGATACIQNTAEKSDTDVFQPQTYKTSASSRPSARIADLDTLGTANYNLRRNRAFTNNADKSKDVECMPKSYYTNIFAGGDSDSYTPSKTGLRSAHGRSLLTDQANGHPRQNDMMDNNRDEPRRNCLAGHSTSRIENLASIQRAKPKSTQGNDFPIKIQHRSCLRNRDHSDTTLFDLNRSGAQTFDYVLRSDCCLLKKRRSLTDKLTQSFRGVLRSGRDRLNGDRPLASSSDTVACGSRRRVTFLEPHVICQEEEDEEAIEATPIGLSSGVSLCRERLSMERLGMQRLGMQRLGMQSGEGSSESNKGSVWGRPTTLLFGITLGLRIMFDTWSGNFDAFRVFDWLYLSDNRNSTK